MATGLLEGPEQHVRNRAGTGRAPTFPRSNQAGTIPHDAPSRGSTANRRHMTRVYCAGPLFNDPERKEMAAIARVLEDAGYATFLPQRDGMELARVKPLLAERGLAAADAGVVVERAIFCLDVFELTVRADAVVANLNGRVPDEGTVVEAALAWQCGKPLVLYKADDRSVFGGSDNPMLTGLGGFGTTGDIDGLPAAVGAALSADLMSERSSIVEMGKEIAETRRRSNGDAILADALLRQFAGARHEFVLRAKH